MSVGKRIKNLRNLRGLTQEEVAQTVGVATQTIYKYEKEIVTNIPLGRLLKIAKALNTTTGYLLGDTDDPDDDSWIIAAFDSGIEELSSEKEIKEAVRQAEKEHLQVLRSICEGDARYKTVTELYNREFMATRIAFVTEFIESNKKFLQMNMPGIVNIKNKNDAENE